MRSTASGGPCSRRCSTKPNRRWRRAPWTRWGRAATWGPPSAPMTPAGIRAWSDWSLRSSRNGCIVRLWPSHPPNRAAPCCAAPRARAPGLIERFGGHAMAAGLSLEASRLEAFRAAFQAHAEAMLDAATLQATLDSDGELAAHEFDRAHAEALRDGGPWGQGFPEPL